MVLCERAWRLHHDHVRSPCVALISTTGCRLLVKAAPCVIHAR
jgi:hypothetical protein